MPFNEKGEIIRTSQSKPLSPEMELEKLKLEEEQRQLFERQNAELDRPPLTDEEEAKSARQRLLVRQNLMNQNLEKK